MTTEANTPIVVQEKRIGLNKIAPYFPMNVEEVNTLKRWGKKVTTAQWNAKMLAILAAWNSPQDAKKFAQRYNVGEETITLFPKQYKAQRAARQLWDDQHSSFFDDFTSWIKNTTLDMLTIGTTGIIDARKGRINVPFSGSQGRATIKALANVGSQQQFQHDVNRVFDSSWSRQVATYGGMAAGAITAYYAGPAIGSGLGKVVGGSGVSGTQAGVGGVGVTEMSAYGPYAAGYQSAGYTFPLAVNPAPFSVVPVTTSPSFLSSLGNSISNSLSNTKSAILAKPVEATISGVGLATTIQRIITSPNPFAALVNSVAGAVGLPPLIQTPPSGGSTPGIPPSFFSSGGGGGGQGFGVGTTNIKSTGLLWILLVGGLVLLALKLRK